MIGAMVAGLAIASGVPLPVVGSFVLAGLAPWPAFGAICVLAWRWSRLRFSDTSQGILTLVSIASELNAGQSLRMAVAASASNEHMPAARRLALSGAPIADVARAVAVETSPDPSLVEAVFQVAGVTGATSAAVFEELASQALSLDDLRREQQAAAAPVILQGVIVGGVPLLVLLSMFVSGSLGRTLESGGLSAMLVAAGAAFVAGGIAVVGVVIKRASR